MIVKIKCEVCGEEIGTIDKPIVTELDQELYRSMTSCSNGHTETTQLVEEVPSEE